MYALHVTERLRRSQFYQLRHHSASCGEYCEGTHTHVPRTVGFLHCSRALHPFGLTCRIALSCVLPYTLVSCCAEAATHKPRSVRSLSRRLSAALRRVAAEAGAIMPRTGQTCQPTSLTLAAPPTRVLRVVRCVRRGHRRRCKAHAVGVVRLYNARACAYLRGLRSHAWHTRVYVCRTFPHCPTMSREYVTPT
jgi:hypothetical protein